MNFTILLYLLPAVISLAVITTANRFNSTDISRNARQANMNNYIDFLMERFGPWLDENGLNPTNLPDMVEHFEVRYLLITYSATIYLWNGYMYNFNHATRIGNSYMFYDRQLMRVRTSASINSLNFRYDYQSIFMNIGGWTGYTEGDIENMVFTADFLVDMWDFYIFMQDFHVESVGNIDIRLRGNILTDWMGNAILAVLTTLFRTTVTAYVSDVMQEFMQKKIDEMNAQNYNQRLVAVTDLLHFSLDSDNLNKIKDRIPKAIFGENKSELSKFLPIL